MGEMENAHRIPIGKPKERDHLEDLSVDGRMILKEISRKQRVRV
jgi:hypothetical protein